MAFKKAFSLLELVLVILILALLVGIALPYFHLSKQDANLFRLKADFTTIQSALAFHKNQDIFTQTQNLAVLDEASIMSEKQTLFYCSISEIKACNGGDCCTKSVLVSPIYSNSKAWMKTGKRTYRFYLSSKSFVDFVYEPSTMSFECVSSSICKELL
ncbi:prepilin-type N-terminal cleavage/methylation domain-containing protein [Campylobacter sp. MIT 97-5078]|uniref:prepilin-type N-terminal cleavage/methylation domain-containing protein n=1 Tax=Campylobacter sp. MIT 97-5078 TaxID=1548153 RepID=UPI0005135C76|nr:prepilin-type N-terminal cleavage/methylation domain-containing protein [Campylobacter sp. MIT 97-5078]KGI55593.1 hypothetical protein LR59_11350 [Campylobacter sp. MIT 97-5078]TQR27548.1 prepilin-type N-terminal cleavage/methylation domain-containing protein [Campylobacter sp. MIT 97-5078]